MTALKIIMVLGLAALASGKAVDLTPDNFDTEVFGGKNAFVKFLAPWCGHCKSMKPAWDDLGSEYSASSVTVGDVDCTVHQDLCTRFGVRGYPTIKYFTDETGEEGDDYQGGRSFDDLKKFVVDKLEAKCDVSAPEEGCNEKEQKYIKKQEGKSAEELQKQLDRLEGMKGSSMKPELKQWLIQRVRILQQLTKSDEGKDEL